MVCGFHDSPLVYPIRKSAETKGSILMSNFTLDDFRAAADKKYGSLTIALPDGSEVELLNVIRLPKAKRDALRDIQETSTEDLDEDAMLKQTISLVCKSEAQANRLFEQVGDDLAVLASILEAYQEKSDLGNASRSAE